MRTDARESYTIADISLATNPELEKGEEDERQGERDSELWAGLTRAIQPDIERISVSVCGGADGQEFIDQMCERFGYDKLMTGEGHIPELENVYINCVYGLNGFYDTSKHTLFDLWTPEMIKILDNLNQIFSRFKCCCVSGRGDAFLRESKTENNLINTIKYAEGSR